MIPEQEMIAKQRWVSRNRSTDSQEVAIVTANCSTSTSPLQNNSRIAMPLSGSSLNKSGRIMMIQERPHNRLPSLEAGCLFQCDDNHDDQDCLDSQVDIVREDGSSIDSDDDDDDIILLSQIKLLLAVATATFEGDDTILHENSNTHNSIESNDDDSLSSSIVSFASCSSESSGDDDDDDDDDIMLLSGPNNKRVVFVCQRNEIHKIPNRKDYSKDEVKKVWYKRDEMHAMIASQIKEDAKLTKQQQEEEKPIMTHLPVDHVFSAELSSTSLPLSLLSPLHGQYLAGDFHRLSCRPSDETGGARIQALIYAVMDQQELQWELDEDDHDMLAEASFIHSRVCVTEALMRAHLDTLEVIPIYLETQQGEEMDGDFRRGASSSEYRRKQQQEEEVCVLSPMAVSPRAKSAKKKRLQARKAEHASTGRWMSPAASTTKKPSSSSWTGTVNKNKNKNGGDRSSNQLLQQNALAMPLRMASNHGAEQQHESNTITRQKQEKNGLSMPMRMESNHDDLDEMDDILSVVSCIDAESESIVINSVDMTGVVSSIAILPLPITATTDDDEMKGDREATKEEISEMSKRSPGACAQEPVGGGCTILLYEERCHQRKEKKTKIPSLNKVVKSPVPVINSIDMTGVVSSSNMDLMYR